MIIEYILLLTAFVFMLMKAVYFGPKNAFDKAGPLLGARMEKHLITGRGFHDDRDQGANWNAQ